MERAANYSPETGGCERGPSHLTGAGGTTVLTSVRTWWRRDSSSVAVCICDASYAILMPPGKWLNRDFEDVLGPEYAEFPPFQPDFDSPTQAPDRAEEALP